MKLIKRMHQFTRHLCDPDFWDSTFASHAMMYDLSSVLRDAFDKIEALEEQIKQLKGEEDNDKHRLHSTTRDER